MEHFDVGENTKVAMITSKYNTTGVVTIPHSGWSNTFSVQANDVAIVTLPHYSENIGSEIKNNVGIQVTSDDPVSVYIHQYHNFRSEASVVLPISSLGSEYYTISYRGYNQNGTDHPSEFLIVGVYDETNISISLSDWSAGGKMPGSSLSIVLNQGETYQVQASTASGDLTGTKISGDKNFALFAGNTWTEVPSGCSFRDNLFEQMLPIETWGKRFVTVPNDKVSYDIFRIMASEDRTHVSVYTAGTEQEYSLDAGQYIEFRQSQASYIEGDRPIQVAQYNIGSSCSGHYLGDPSMVLLNSVEQRRDTVTLYNSSLQAIQENYINIIVSTEDVPFVTFDGNPIPTNATKGTVGLKNEYTYFRIQVNSGAHTIISQACGVIATAYGYGEVESYAYGGGANFNSINTNPIPEGGCLHDTVFFDANLPEPRYTFFWDLGDGNTSSEARFDHFYPNLGYYPVMLIIMDNCQQTVDTLYKDLLISLRQAVAVDGPDMICEGEPIFLGATDLSNARYEWVGPAGFLSDHQFPTIKSATPLNSGEYAAIGIVSGCATYPAIVEVDVISTPKPDLGADALFCSMDSATTISPGEFSSYEWQDHSFSSSFNVIEEGTYWVKVTDDYGCSNSDTIFLKQLCPTEVFIPNAFSPNNDGVNDIFQISGHDIISLKINIFNRWGNSVYTGQSQNSFWDGTYNGNPVPSGVYIYLIEVEGYHKDGSTYLNHLSGSITVLR